jgi:hypothetical protein
MGGLTNFMAAQEVLNQDVHGSGVSDETVTHVSEKATRVV